MVKVDRNNGQNYADNIVDPFLDFNGVANWTVTSGTGASSHSALKIFEGDRSLEIVNQDPVNDIVVTNTTQETIIVISGDYEVSFFVRKDEALETFTGKVNIFRNAVLLDTQNFSIGTDGTDPDLPDLNDVWVRFVGDVPLPLLRDDDITFTFELDGIPLTALVTTTIYIDGFMLNPKERLNAMPPYYTPPRGDDRILNQDPLLDNPGAINYDPIKGTMNVRNIFPGSSIQVGQENVVFVINNTGFTITEGNIVHVNGYDAVNDALEIVLSLADKVEETEVIGVTTTNMADGQTGLITVFGRVNDLDTTSFLGGDIIYLSETIPGGITSIRPSIPIQIGHVGRIDISEGFIQVEIRELERSIYGGYSDLTTQTFIAATATPIGFGSNEEFSGIEHSETVDNSEFTFTSGGVYQLTIEPQVLRNAGGSGTDVLDVWIQKDIGAGFVNIPDSNIKRTVAGSQATGITPLTITLRLTAEDKVRFMANVSNVSLELRFTAATGAIPATPSVIANIVRIGD